MPPAPQVLLHCFGLLALVVARPLFDLLSSSPEYFVVNDLGRHEIIAWLVLLSLALPLATALVLLLLGRLNRTAGFLAYALFVALSLALFGLQLGKHYLPGSTAGALLLAAGLVLLAVMVLWRHSALLFGLALLSPAALIVPWLFVHDLSGQRILDDEFRPDADAIGGGAVWVGRPVPVVFAIFDELALVDLLDARGEIDAKRFPNIAAFASQATWYSNATTVRHATLHAIPAMLTGVWPPPGALPRYQDYPRNLFSLLRPYYEFNVVEPVTSLHAGEGESTDRASEPDGRLTHLEVLLGDSAILFAHLVTPDGWSGRLPPVNVTWGGFLLQADGNGPAPAAAQADIEQLAPEQRAENRSAHEKLMHSGLHTDRRALFGSFQSGIAGKPANTVHFMHILLPHRPSIYLPDGNEYSQGERIRGVREDRETKAWIGSPDLVDKVHQRHLLQLGFLDRLWGGLVNTLKELGLYEQALIVFVADHGISFQPGVSNRRPTPENFGELAFVPLIIKYPGQAEPARDDSNVQTIDLLPTLVDALDVTVDWTFDGRSLLQAGTDGPASKIMPVPGGQPLEYTRQEYLARRAEALQRNVQSFSLDQAEASLYHYEPGLEWVGQHLSVAGTAIPECQVTLGASADAGNTGSATLPLPARVTGSIDCPTEVIDEFLLVFSVNEWIVAVTRPYAFEGATLFDHIIPHQAGVSGPSLLETRVVRREASTPE